MIRSASRIINLFFLANRDDCFDGLNVRGEGKSAIIVAISCLDKSFSFLPKYISAAMGIPYIPCPVSATFKYTSIIRFLPQMNSIKTVKYASIAFLKYERRGYRKVFLAVCCDIVLPPMIFLWV